MSTTITLLGMDEVLDALTRMGNLRGFKRGMAAGGAYLLAQLQRYPPQPPNSTYKRTGTLGRGWVMEGRRGGMQVVIGNATPYAPKVQGISGTQSSFFAERGWIGPDTAMDRYGDAIADLVRAYTEMDG